jgi:hypothetical protein
MRGRAKQILEDFRRGYPDVSGTFKMSRIILLSNITPEELTDDLDDPEVEERLRKAIFKVTGYLVRV